MKKANADVIAISAHPFTTCGVLREMKRQKVKPKLLVGLTSSSSMETLNGCANEAEGIIIPTSFAPVTDAARLAAAATAEQGGSADLHSAAAWEIVMVLKDVIESNGIEAKSDTVQSDRRKIRDGLAALKETDGLSAQLVELRKGKPTSPTFLHTQKLANGRYCITRSRSPVCTAGWAVQRPNPRTTRLPSASSGQRLDTIRLEPHRSNKRARAPQIKPINKGTAMEWIDVIQAISDGVMKGSTYAIIGIGFTLIFGVMHKLNLAYAAVSIAGAYASLTLISYFPETNVFIVFPHGGCGLRDTRLFGLPVVLQVHPAGKTPWQR
ncbi:MAG: hypothetical protein CM1200mP20_04850 [Pseudomonadota bacterium]|nr:MAG: hypothetical protein CM1200mP20_04850 [Pseudomonadota bacterium]